MKPHDKVETLLGFAIRAGKVVFGYDNIESNRKCVLIIVCKSLSQNAKERVLRKAGKTTVIETQCALSEITHRNGCKAIALTDKQMAHAVINCLNERYHLVTEVTD